MKKVRVAIIGSGPAGLTAALYTARAELSTAVIIGPQFGGQIATTHEVDNFPAFPDGITGPELAERMKAQAEKFGAEFVWDSVTSVDFSKGSPFTINTYSETFSADAVIVTIGASPRHLNIPGEVEYTGRGVSYCATCDGAFFRNRELIVVGGGDSALQEAIFLTKFASSVTVVHRRDTLRASIALQTKAKANPKIKFIYDTVVDEVLGENGLTNGVMLRDMKTNERYHKAIDGVFIFIGYDPNSRVFGDQLALDEAGYLKVDHTHHTSVDGVFAGGEIHDQTFRQAITASGQGCSAALMTIKWVDDREQLQPLDDTAAVTQTAS
ncbi:MAG: thioredoxin-disulfide reductase [Anaerolineae bacterium]